jgi:hypothetical protein
MARNRNGDFVWGARLRYRPIGAWLLNAARHLWVRLDFAIGDGLEVCPNPELKRSSANVDRQRQPLSITAQMANQCLNPKTKLFGIRLLHFRKSSGWLFGAQHRKEFDSGISKLNKAKASISSTNHH